MELSGARCFPEANDGSPAGYTPQTDQFALLTKLGGTLAFVGLQTPHFFAIHARWKGGFETNKKFHDFRYFLF